MRDVNSAAVTVRRVVIAFSLALVLGGFLAGDGHAQPLARQLRQLVLSAQASAGASGAAASGAAASAAANSAAADGGSSEWPRPRQILRALRLNIEQRAPVLIAELVAALLVFAFFYLLQRAAVRLLTGVLHRTHADAAVSGIGIKLTRYLLLGVGFLTALQQLGVQVTSLLAGVGIAGLAIGLAAQETIANLIAGFTLLLEKPFRIGDSVTIAGTAGQIIEIGLRSTHLRTVDVRDAFLPNREIINHLIVNHTMTPQLRLDLPLSVSYAADLDRARAVLLEAAAGNPAIAADPPPQVLVVALADSAVNLELRLWLRSGQDDAGVRFQVLEKAKKGLDAAGIEIPFPQRVVRLLPASPPD